jgi:Nuclease-related domain
VIRAGTNGETSARAEHARRRATRHGRLRSRYGGLAGPVDYLLKEQASERVWRRGSEGEERAGRGLEKLLQGSGVRLLHDRHVPGGVVTLDHVAVGPTGVTLIDKKRWRGKVRVRRGRLWVADRDRTEIIERLRRQMEVIRLGLATCHDVPVNGAICWIEVDGLPWLGRLRVDGVPIAGPRRLAENLRKSGSVSSARVGHVARLLDSRLPRLQLGEVRRRGSQRGSGIAGRSEVAATGAADQVDDPGRAYH